ncbi:hypothetical protein D4R99_01070 [bacterium]|nr:MAG: hypothetical protein D4R99_01070 [bacterium]
MTLKNLALFLLLSVFASLSVFADNGREPFFKTDNAECSVWGYANIVGGTDSDFTANAIRLRTSCKYKSFSFFMENDIAGLNDEVAANYITQAWVAYHFGKEGMVGDMFGDTTIRAGSIVTAARMYLPAAYETIPVEGPANPFHPYGYGVQIQTKITPNLLFVGDVTGTTTPAFDDSERWNGTETSERLVWDALHDGEMGKTNLQLSVFHQESDTADRIGFGIKYNPTENLDLYGGLYRTDEKIKGENTGGYALADYKLWSMENNALDLRIMGMVEMKGGSSPYTGFSGGLSLVLPQNGGYGRFAGTSATVDFTHSNTTINDGMDTDDNLLMTRIRIFF